MKNLIIVVLLAAGVVFGSLYFRQASQARAHEEELVKLEAQLKEKATEAAKAEAAERKMKELKSRLSQTAVTAAERSSQVAALEQKLESAKTNSESGMKGLGAMFKSPEMREMIRNQQKMVIGPMIEKSYAPFFQQLNMNDEQKVYLKDLMQKKLLGNMDAGMELMSADSDKREELGKKIKDDSAAYDAQIKQYLGDQYYPQFEAYEKTVPDRMQLGQFKDQLAGSQNALTPDQEQGLIQAMSDERANFKWNTDYTDKAKIQANPAEMLSEDRLNKLADDLEQFSLRVLPHAQQLLSAGQYASFQTFFKTQSQMQVAQMKIAAQMFAPKGK